MFTLAGRPMMRGSSNCSKVTSVTRMIGASRPGSSTGRVMRRKAVRVPAPAMAAASSSTGDMPRRAAQICRKTKGALTTDWQAMRPPMEKTFSGPSPVIPKRVRMNWFAQPALGPKSMIQAMAITGTGTSRGATIRANQRLRPGRSVRSTSQASAKATMVVRHTVPATKTSVSGRMRVTSAGSEISPRRLSRV